MSGNPTYQDLRPFGWQTATGNSKMSGMEESSTTLAQPTRRYGISNPAFWPATVLIVGILGVFLIIVFFLHGDLDRWWILVLPALLVLPLVYIFHRGTLSWIRVGREEVEIAPSWFQRKFWGEASKSARFDSGSELLFCKRIAYGSFDSYSIILRPHSGPDHVLWGRHEDSTGVGWRWWSRIAREIGDTSPLKTRLIEQGVSSQGTSEAEWPTVDGKKLWQGLRMAIPFAIAPWLGIGARVLTGDYLKLVGIGVILWIGSMVWISYWARSGGKTHRQELYERLLPLILQSALQFATIYTVTVLVTGALLRH